MPRTKNTTPPITLQSTLSLERSRLTTMKLAVLTTIAAHVALAVAAADTLEAMPNLIGPEQLAAITSDEDTDPTCNRNGGSTMSFTGPCNSRNYTWTEQCNVEEKNGECITTANSCGCVVSEPNNGSSGIGSGTIKGCDNACVTITDQVPQNRTCQASGSATSFQGACHSLNYIYTPNCNFAETVDDQNNVVQCTITANSCGCLWWKEDSEWIEGLQAGGKSCSDPCSVHGYPASTGAAAGLKTLVVGVALSVSWFAM